ncbi:clan AA aspartic protease [candidate division WWE3 bacterium]|uniref:Clan AA aspartic protease n=1 Tax=candidate division WWE3 bacterium TaxID=2053526 RepID=A0A955RQQ3_UNCKA|nr:clan AA aspartic protease [candidate division WWE3 bacterium]
MTEQAILKTFDPRAGIILVTATITSHIEMKARLVFDTGATYCMLPWWLINNLQIKINPKNVTQTTTASSVETSPIVKLPALEVLNEKVENVTCLVRDLPPMSNVDGLLGLSFLKYFNVNINFEEGELSLDRY